MAGPRTGVTAAVCAYNEAANIERLLHTLLTRDSAFFDELIVVSSGSTDGTDDIVRDLQPRFPQLRLIVEPERRGKASAVNLALSEARGEVLLLVDADCLPAEGCIARLLSNFEDPEVGGVGSRNVVTNPRVSMVSRAADVMWELHHLICLRAPVLGGDIDAFRTLVGAIPPGTVNDDYAVEALLSLRGYRIAYEPEAKVLMKAPTTVADFLRQRQRIEAGFRDETRAEARKATNDPSLRRRAAWDLLRRRPASLPWLGLLWVLELYVRGSLVVRALRGQRRYYTAWEPALSTKGRLPQSDQRETSP